MKWQWFLRPIALPAFLVGLLFVIIPFGPIVTVAGAVFYALAVYRAYRGDRDKALPAGIEDEVGKLPYKRRRVAELAIAAARDIERRLTALPRDLAARVPVTPAEAGKLAAGVVFYLRREADAAALAKTASGAGMDGVAAEAGRRAEDLFTRIQELQTTLGALALEAGDTAALALQAAKAAREALEMTQAMEAARLELEGVTPAAALPPGTEKSDKHEGG